MAIALSEVSNVRMFPVRSDRDVHKSIQAFLSYKGKKSENTRAAYETDIKMFFLITRRKGLEDLSESDLQYVYEDIVEYQDKLVEMEDTKGNPKYKNSSINRKIKAVRSLFNFLKKNRYPVDTIAFEIDELPEVDSMSAGSLSQEEAEQMAREAMNLPSGLEKSLLIELAYKTSIRLSALLSLKWSNFIRVSDSKYLVTVVGKGNKLNKKPITSDFYERILQLKVNNSFDDAHLFSIKRTSVHNTIKELCNLLGIPKERNVSFHSLKGRGIDYVIDETGDIIAASLQGDHSNINTTYKYYANKNIDYNRYAGIMMEEKKDLSILDSLDKEQLISLIKQCSKKTQNEILKLAEQEVK